MNRTAKILVSLLFVAIAVIGVVALAPTVAKADCQPVACPAIAKLCPSGEFACRVSPCNCVLACVPPGSPACI